MRQARNSGAAFVLAYPASSWRAAVVFSPWRDDAAGGLFEQQPLLRD